MRLYLQLMQLFLGAGTVFGFAMGILITMGTNWMVGLAFGFSSGLLLAFGVPLILFVAGRKNRAVVDGRDQPRTQPV